MEKVEERSTKRKEWMKDLRKEGATIEEEAKEMVEKKAKMTVEE